MAYAIVIAVLASYLLGNLNGAVCMSTLLSHEDVREHGSGNAGLTNFARNYGGWNSLLVVLIDGGKAVIATMLSGLLLKPYGLESEGMMLGAVAVSLGHDFPALLGFRGGKGILSGFLCAVVMDWRVALLVVSLFALTYVLSGYVSLGSVMGAGSYAVGFVIWHHSQPWVMAGGIFIGVLALFMHRSNISRLIHGTESKTNLFKGRKRK